MRALGWSLLGLLATLVLLVTLLCYSSTGLRSGLNLAERLVPGLQITEVDGRLADQLSLHGLRYENAGLIVELDRLTLDWQPWLLWQGLLQINLLELGAISIELPQNSGESSDSEALRLPQPLLPVAVELTELKINQLSIRRAGAQLFAASDSRLSAQLRGSDIELRELRSRVEPVGPVSAQAKARLLASQVIVEELSLSGPGQINATGQLDWLANQLQLHAAWTELQWPPQAQNTAESGLIIRSALGSLTLSGALSGPAIELQAELGERSTVSANGTLDPENLQLQARWTQLQWPLSGTKPQILSPQGELVFSGLPDDWQARLNAEALRDGQQAQLSATATGNTMMATLSSLEIRALSGVIRGDGAVNWGNASTAQASLSLAQINPQALAPDWPGQLNGRLQAELSWAPVLRYQANWQLQDSRILERELSSNGSLSGQDQSLTLGDTQLRSGDSALQISGALLPELGLQASLASDDLGDFAPQLSGRAELDAQISGNWRLPVLDVEGQLQEFALANLRVGTATIKTRIDQQGVIDSQISASDIYSGYRFQEARIVTRGPAGDHQIQLYASGDDGSAELALRGRYQPEALRWDGVLERGELRPEQFAPWTLEDSAALVLAPGDIQLDPTCWSGNDGRVCGQMQLAGEQLQAAWRLDRFELAAIQVLLPPDLRLQGQLTGRGSLGLRNGVLTRADVELSSSPGEIAAGQKTRMAFGASELVLSETSEGTEFSAQLAVADGQLGLQGRLRGSQAIAQRPLSGNLSVSLPQLDALALLSPEISAASGALEGQFTLSGKLAEPLLDGQLALKDGELQLDTPGITISNLQGEISAARQQGLRFNASGQSGEGQAQVTGSWTPADPETQLQLRLQGEQLQAANTPEARIWVSPDLELKQTPRRLSLKGKLLIPRADITPQKFSAGGGVSPSADQVIVNGNGEIEESGGSNLQAQVEVVLGDKVRFEGFGLKTKLAGSITAIERPGKLTAGRGELRLVDGRYQAYGQDLAIDTGRLIFGGGPIINPSLDLSASRTPREDIKVGVQVRGPLDSPSLNLYSSPPMNQEAQLSWLVLGRPLDDGTGDAERQAVASAALALGLKGTDFIAGKLSSKLGIDEISIGSKPGETADQARFTIGKYLSPKLYVSYGVGLFQPGYSVQMEYDIGSGFKLATETGVESGGDLIYTIER